MSDDWMERFKEADALQRVAFTGDDKVMLEYLMGKYPKLFKSGAADFIKSKTLKG